MTEKQTDDELIDEASVESFPASDPPSWTMGKSADDDEPAPLPEPKLPPPPPLPPPHRPKTKPRA